MKRYKFFLYMAASFMAGYGSFYLIKYIEISILLNKLIGGGM